MNVTCKKCGNKGESTISQRTDYCHRIDCPSCGYGVVGEDLVRISETFEGKIMSKAEQENARVFRGKSMETGEWLVGRYFFFNKTHWIPVLETKYHPLEMPMIIDPSTLCEWTGFEDSHGLMIFEGDILMEKYDEHEMNPSTFIVTEDKKAQSFLGLDGGDYYTVIGNIYDQKGERK